MSTSVAIETLRGVSQTLSSLSTSTEQDFLVVGGKLEEVVNGARQKADALCGLSAVVDGAQGQALTAALDQVTAWAGAAETESSDSALEELLKIARSLSRPLGNLKNTVQLLRAMGVLMLVESARLGSQTSDFHVLAEDVKALAASVDQKSDVILDAVDALSRLLRNAQATAIGLHREQQARMVRVVSESTAGLHDLHAEHDAIAEVSRNAQAGFQRVVSGIGNLVVSLQFHDSMRQRLEHIAEALTSVIDEESGSLASTAVPVLELQAAQLNDASCSFQKAMDQVRGNLKELKDTVANFAETAREIAANGSAHSAIEKDDRFSGISEVVAEWSESRRGLTEAAGEACRACSQMSGWAAEVETVGRHLFRLAVNAEVEAFRASSSGTVMVAVADTLRSVSRDASDCASGVIRVLREVEASATGLASSLAGDLASRSQRASDMAAQIRGAVSELRDKNSQSRSALHSIALDGDALAQEIAALQEGLTADRMLAETSSSCLDSLESVAAELRSAAGDPDAEQHAAMLHRALRTYTMQAEREVHESLAGGVAVVSAAASQSANELGDNVELF